MKCDQCNDNIEAGEEMDMHGRTLCEDCYIDALSPPKACNPWAVHSAKTFAKEEGATVTLTETQAKILRMLKDTGGLEPETAIEKLGMKATDFEREIATLRHMEKVRAELRDGKKTLCIA